MEDYAKHCSHPTPSPTLADDSRSAEESAEMEPVREKVRRKSKRKRKSEESDECFDVDAEDCGQKVFLCGDHDYEQKMHEQCPVTCKTCDGRWGKDWD